MKIFLSYGHDSNAPLIEKIRDYLSKDAEGNLKHEVWIDTSEIKAGMNWREKIVKGLLESDIVLAGLSEHSTKEPGVCRDEISISIGVKGGNIRTILLEPSNIVAPPAMISHIQWLDMSDWREYETEGFNSEYFQEKFRQIAEMIETPENERFNGEITQLKEALEPISSISRIKSLTEKEMYGRKWLYEKIEEWDKSSSQRLFWIVAGPGFGKSMFAANLQEQYNARIPAIQFVEWGKPDHSNPCRILKNLAFQLAVRYPEYRTFVLQQPDVINKKLNEKNEDELFDLLFCESTWMKIDGGQENVWVLIDALDEANDKFDNKIAQTLARHMDRMPQWMRFILTSRDDSKVRLPLQKYHPQIFDLEAYVKEKNSEDLLLYVRGELSNLHPTEEQVQQIVDKSQGVFLYLSLCIEGIHKGEYSLDHLDKLPDGLNGYYYELFTRQFGNDIKEYRENIAPILQLMVAAKKNLHLPFIKYLLGISDSKLYEICAALEHICRTVKEDGVEIISFFHNSIENWITNHRLSGLFYVSKDEGHIIIASKYVQWLLNPSPNKDILWQNYKYGLYHLQESGYEWPKRIENAKTSSMLCSMHYNGGLGAMTKGQNDAIYNQCKQFLETNTDEGFFGFLGLVIDLFEKVIDGYVDSGIVSKNTRCYTSDYSRPIQPSGTIWNAIADSGSIGALFRMLFDYPLGDMQLALAVIVLDVLAFYDYILGRDVRFSSVSDAGDFTSRELMEISEALKEKMKTHKDIAMPAVLFFSFRAIRYPEQYPANGLFQLKELGYIYECMQKKDDAISLYRLFVNEFSPKDNDLGSKVALANAYEAIARLLSTSNNEAEKKQSFDALKKAEEYYVIICRETSKYYRSLAAVQNNLGLQSEAMGNRSGAKELLKKAINNSLKIEDRTENDTAALATFYINLGIVLSKVNDSGYANKDDLDQAYEMFEECEKYRIQLARNNPSQYLQPLGMILLRMAGFYCQASDEFGARLYLMKARFIYERTYLKREQYEGALQQISDNLSQMKKARKWFFGMFRINENMLNEEFEEFVNYFK